MVILLGLFKYFMVALDNNIKICYSNFEHQIAYSQTILTVMEAKYNE